MKNTKIICAFTHDKVFINELKTSIETLNYEYIVKIYDQFLLDIHFYDPKDLYLIIDGSYIDIEVPERYKERVVYVFDTYSEVEFNFITKLTSSKNFYLKQNFSLNKLSLLYENSNLENDLKIASNKYNILTVDDVVSNLVLIEHFLAHENWKIFKASNAFETIKSCLENEIHLIILDIQLPGLDGYEIASILKQNFFTKNIPIIFLTAINKESKHVVKGLQHGAIDYLYKPVDKNILRSKVETLLKYFEYQRTLENTNSQLIQQKKTIDQKNIALTDSINYAARLQQSILPKKIVLSQSFSKVSILYKPKDILSGDFYFFWESIDYTVWAVVDCTGHGIPGAIMSSSVHSFLLNIINAQKTFNLKEIISKLNNEIYMLLSGGVKDKVDISDGADIGLCVIQHQNQKLYFTGINIPLWKSSLNAEIEDFKPNKNTLGWYQEVPEIFLIHEISFSKGDRFYMFTDGVYDQLGGTSMEKYKKKNLKELIQVNRNVDLDQQVLNIDDQLIKWRGINDQTDDMCLISVEY